MEPRKGLSQEELRKVADSNEYQEFELRHNRHLNMLSDNDRNIRKQALMELRKAI